ncbi:MAG: hypothetical protein K6C05_01175 [Anaerovibrio sp.]|uniref:hypothetical protein n=1 Tax=Anaerovibrio sp. TaxID=1872532 RepID=UPI0025DCAA5A|nr:hypothetical protein [Anaerovibrio sp.]MCR5175441.1 hypothetical protein [Anaerovibrio sp.]
MLKFLGFEIRAPLDCIFYTARLRIYKHSAKYEILNLPHDQKEETTLYKNKQLPIKKPELLSAWESLNINSWDDEYFPPMGVIVCDGLEWELVYREEGQKSRHIFGKNAYPPNWKQFILWIDALMPEMKFADFSDLENF